MDDQQAYSAFMSFSAMAMRYYADSSRGFCSERMPRAATMLRRCVEATRAKAASATRDSAAAEQEMLAIAAEMSALAAEMRAYCAEMNAAAAAAHAASLVPLAPGDDVGQKIDAHTAQFDPFPLKPTAFAAKLAAFSVKLKHLVPMMDPTFAGDLLSLIDVLSEFQGSGIDWVLSKLRLQA